MEYKHRDLTSKRERVMVARRRLGESFTSWLIAAGPNWLALATMIICAYMFIKEVRRELHVSSSIAGLYSPSRLVHVNPEGVGKLPALGWNSWNAFHCDIDSVKIMTAANMIINLGLKDVGYEYVNIDDCWSVKTNRDLVTKKMIPDPIKFPEGISGIADQVHALDLKFGLYSSAGTKTCAGYPASIEFEYLDASTFAEWGVDYLKYDNCNVPKKWKDEYQFCVPDSDRSHTIFPNGTCPAISNPAPPNYDWATSQTAERFRRMGNALLAQNRTIFYSLCEWGHADVTSWGNATAHSWRMSGDITPHWYRVAEILNINSFLLNSVDFWSHNDADMLEVGNGDLTFVESRSHFAFWAAMKSPLIIGTALDKLSGDLIDVLKNKYLLAFSQDETYGKPAMPYKWGVNSDWTFDSSHPAEYWSGASSNGVLVLMLNSLGRNATREVKWADVPELEEEHAYQVTDVWTGEDLGCVGGGISRMLESHDTAVFLVGEKCRQKVQKERGEYW